ncbi:SPFH domain-containing protein [Actinomadura rugatobispora]|uniref:SPFH domain-containing protein n=1 Tax=Actinomadura rugatobispora TaxID=1994 RepID=A0ABW0ZSA0_9ACTN|nr:hypothetical protein GCM10010200_023660 [Actinomadura rugatobispora]
MDVQNSLGARAGMLLLLAGLLVVVAAAAGIRRVAEGERLVVLRFGKVRGAHGPGLRYLAPIADRGVRVSMRAAPLDVWFRGTTRDGVPVQVKALAMVGAADPVRYALAARTPSAADRAVAEIALRSVIAARDLEALPRMISDGDPELLERLNAAIEPWGATATLVTITDVQVPVRAELLRWARDLGAAPGADPGAEPAAGPGHRVG